MTQSEQPAGAKTPTRIAIVGIGGSGTRLLHRLAKKPVPEVRYVVCDTGVRLLDLSPPGVTAFELRRWGYHGFGEYSPAEARQMAEESSFIRRMKGGVKNAELVILTAGMGGAIGSGASPVIAQTIKETGAFVLAFVTTPFSFEWQKYRQQAAEALKHLGAHADNIVVIDNDRILQRLDKSTTIEQAFPAADQVMEKGILSVVQSLNVFDTINIDLDGLKKVMCLPGRAFLAMGQSSHPQSPAMEAAKNALANPLNDADLSQAKGLLMSFRGGPNLGLGEYQEAMAFISSKVKPGSPVVFGASHDKEQGTVVDLTLIATGVPELPPPSTAQPGGWWRRLTGKGKT